MGGSTEDSLQSGVGEQVGDREATEHVDKVEIRDVRMSGGGLEVLCGDAPDCESPNGFTREWPRESLAAVSFKTAERIVS